MARLETKERSPHASTAKSGSAVLEVVEAPTIAVGWTAPTGAAIRPQSRFSIKRLVLICVLLAVLVIAIWLVRGAQHAAPVSDIQTFNVCRRSFPVILKERGELAAASSIDIRSEIEGHATIIYVISEGSRVKEGELLIELASDEIDEKTRDAESKEANAIANHETALKTRDILRDENASKVRKSALALHQAELAKQKFIEGDKKQLDQDATLAVDKAKMVLQRQKQDLKDAQELYEQGFITRVELKNAEFNEYASGLELAKAELALEVLKKYTIPMALEQVQSNVDEAAKEYERERKAAAASEDKATADVEAKKSDLDIARDKLAKLREQKAKTKINAPSAGLVVYARAVSYRTESTIETGVQVHERQMLIQLPDTSRMKVEVRVHEAQIERLQVGMPANVQIEGFSNRTFTGKVSKIAVMADSQNMFFNPNLREYKTDILLDGTFTELKPNITARVEIQMAQLDNVLAVPIQAVFAKAGKFFLFTDKAGAITPVQVQPGLSSAEFVQIKSGIKEGQPIRLAVTEEMKMLVPDEGEDNGTEGEHRSRPKPNAKIVPLPTSQPAVASPTRRLPAVSEPERRPVTTREGR